MNIIAFLYVLLIASLPFFSFRVFVGDVSLTLFLWCGIAIFLFYYLWLKHKFPNFISFFDVIIAVYIAFCLLSFPFSRDDSSLFALIKTIVYFLFYLGLKFSLTKFGRDQVVNLTNYGIFTGIFLFSSLIIYVLFSKDLFSTVFSNVSYYNTTMKLYSGALSLFGEDVPVKSRDFMRNALGECFAFYFVFVAFAGFRNKLARYFFASLGFFYSFFMFSRRAFLSVVVSVFYMIFKRMSMAKLILLCLATIGVIFFVGLGGMQIGGRLFDYSDPSRIAQYGEVFDLISERIFFGYGYGAKISDEKYVHNFILASFYMMGIVGFLLSFFIYFILMFEYLSGLILKNISFIHVVLIIPIMGLSVGSTVEGIFTPVGWIILAIYGSCSDSKSLFFDNIFSGFSLHLTQSHKND